MKRDYDRYANVNKYEPGDIIYVYEDGYEKGVSGKLRSRFHGPYVVEDNSDPPVLKIKFANKSDLVHHDKIRKAGGRYTPMRVLRDRHEILFPDEPFSQSQAQKQIKTNTLLPPDIEKKITKKTHKTQPLKIIPNTDLDETIPFDIEEPTSNENGKLSSTSTNKLKEDIQSNHTKYKWPIKLRLGKSDHEYYIIPQNDAHQVSTRKRHSTRRQLSKKTEVSKIPLLTTIAEIEPLKLRLDKSRNEYYVTTNKDQTGPNRIIDPIDTKSINIENRLFPILEMEEPNYDDNSRAYYMCIQSLYVDE
jgi:hypothetical protein